ncbi:MULTISPECIES: hypothetical protein [unclassified Knoellia]|uniref:hypothetical protein n=1 Tax=Knoellia altitudinis TaxID=3404795 RepID=UPI003620E200
MSQPPTGPDGWVARPLLPTLTDPAHDAQLRDSLSVLRDTCPDEALRARIGEVLAGRAQLRDLAGDPDFGSFVTPLTERGMELFEEYERAVAEPGGGSPESVRPPAPPAPPTHGTW